MRQVLSMIMTRRRTSMWRVTLLVLGLLVLGLTLGYSRAARAAPRQTGDFITYTQSNWGVSTNPSDAILIKDYASVYASKFGLLTLGLPSPGFSIVFDGASSVIAYLPAFGTPAPLNLNLVDPLTTSSGEFGGSSPGRPPWTIAVAFSGLSSYRWPSST